MKGIVFNYLEDFVVEGFGEDKWDALFSKCPAHAQEIYVGPETYPDSHMVAILTVASKQLELPPEKILHAFGKYLFKRLAEDYHALMKPYDHPKPFLMSIDGIIHVEVMKMMEKASPPKFTYQDTGPNTLQMNYYSHRKLCPLMEGILEGVDLHYGISIKYSHSKCLSKGDECCSFELEFLG